MKKRLYLIEWIDSYGDRSNQWFELDNIQSPQKVICLSVGWIEKESKHGITIVSHISGVKDKKSDRYGTGILTIPTKAIIRKVNLPFP